MRRLDRYVLGAFLGPFITLSFLIVALFVVIDLFGRFDEFLHLENTSILWAVLTYYAYVLPGILTEWLLPIITVIAGLFAVSSLDRHHEITAMLSSGISRQRLLAPLLCATAIISLGDFVLKSQVIPEVAGKRETIRAQMKGDKDAGKRVRKVAMSNRTKDGYNFWYALEIDTVQKQINGLFLTRMDLAGKWVYRLKAEKARRVADGWVLSQVQIQQTGEQELPQYHEQMTIATNLTIDNLLLHRKELKHLSDGDLRRMSSSGRMYTELISRPATSITSFVLFLWSMIVLFYAREGAFFVAASRCVLMVFGYYGFMWMLLQVAAHSAFNPALIIYGPIGLLLLLGLRLYRRMPS